MDRMRRPAHAAAIGAISAAAIASAAPAPAHHWTGDRHALDSAGTADGVPIGTASFAPGRVGPAFAFDGAGIVNLGHGPGDFGTGDFTIDFWILGDVAGPLQAVLSNRQACDYGWFWDIRGRRELVLVVDSDPTPAMQAWATGGPALGGGWRKVTFRRSGSTLSAFTDGRRVRDVAIDPLLDVSSPAPLILAGGPCVGRDGTRRLVGRVDELRLYATALTDDEIRRLACPVDQDGDGLATVEDLQTFLAWFREGSADFDGDGRCDVLDLLAYLGAFRSGCP